MPHHRFKLGQTVVSKSLAVASERYVIVRLLALLGDIPRYHATSDNGTVCVLVETQIAQVIQHPAAIGTARPVYLPLATLDDISDKMVPD